jgi:hypothetical protein
MNHRQSGGVVRAREKGVTASFLPPSINRRALGAWRRLSTLDVFPMVVLGLEAY